jgi:hypothetical protein
LRREPWEVRRDALASLYVTPSMTRISTRESGWQLRDDDAGGEPDECGIEFPTIEAAYIDAYQQQSTSGLRLGRRAAI